MQFQAQKSHPKHQLTGRHFGRLTVLKLIPGITRKRYWLCRCDCGEQVEVRTDQLTLDVTKSCGCLQREAAARLGHSGLTHETANLRLRRARRTSKGLPTNLGIRDLTGRRFGQLKVLKFVRVQKQQSLWRCRCDCGKTTIVTAARLNYGWTKSCGCLQQEYETHNLRHGQAAKGYETAEYRAWSSMKTRCYNPNNKSYNDYGGRGITICQRWIDSFETFFADMGPKPSGRSLDRKNNDGNYNKRNCRWATSSQQNHNRHF